jgi:predicted RND superfamily exporter protein
MGAFIWSLIIFYPNSYKYEVSQKIIKRFELMPVMDKRWTVLLFILLSLLFIPGLLKIRAEIYSLSILTEKDKAYRDHVYTESNVGNYFPLEYIIDERKIDRKQVSKWVNEVYRLSNIDAAIVYYQIPRTLNIRELGYQSKTNPNIYRLTFMVPLMSTTEGMQLVDSISNISGKYFGDQLPELTGFITLYSNVANGLFTSFKQSLTLAFIIIFILITLYLRNFKLILFALIVNIFSILAMLGLMGWLGIHLDMVTIPIGCLLISIVVDDTIHLMYWYKMKRNLKDALTQAGPGIFFTTVLLSLGFSILLLSDAPPVAYFAILSLFALATALLGDLILLPSLLKK